jgi:UDP-3-O-[3-hydroxymyristoyl] glucosamine N-acyltransferase
MRLLLPVAELAALLQSKSTFDENIMLNALCSLETATENDVAVVYDPDTQQPFPPLELEKVARSKAGYIIASAELVPGKKYIIVDDPLAAITQLVAHLRAQRPALTCSPNFPHACISPETEIGTGVIIEPGVTIKPGAKIGDNSLLQANSYIDYNVIIGKSCIIGPSVTIYADTVIGNNVQIDAGTVLGADGFGYRFTQRGITKVPHVGSVKIGNHAEIGACATIDRAVFDVTSVGDGCKIDNMVYLAHNVVVGPHSVILAQATIAGSVTIGPFCQIGAQTAIKDHTKIGSGVKIVAKSGVMENLPDKAVVAGFPAIPFMEWKRISVSLSKLPELMRRVSTFLSPSSKKSWWQRFFQ